MMSMSARSKASKSRVDDKLTVDAGFTYFKSDLRTECQKQPGAAEACQTGQVRPAYPRRRQNKV